MIKKTPGKNNGFTFIEMIITTSLFLLMAGIGMGAYFKYYNMSLSQTDIENVTTLMKQARFKAQKNPTSSDYGVYIEKNTNTLTSFKEKYNSANENNIVLQLKQLRMGELNLYPEPGTTNFILFEKQTGKTQNNGSFTLENNEYSYTFNINNQGVIN